MFSPTALARFVHETVVSTATASEFFAAVDEARLDLARVVDVLASPYDHLVESQAADVEDTVDWGPWASLLYELASYYGLERTIDIAAQTLAFRHVDVRIEVLAVEARLQARAALAADASIDDVYALITAPDMKPSDRDELLGTLAARYPLDALAKIGRHIAPAHAEVIGRALRRRLSALDACEAMLESVEDDDLVDALDRYWGVRTNHERGTRDAVLALYAHLARIELRPMAGPLQVAMLRGEPCWWLPILRDEGLGASRAALELLESGETVASIAGLLAAAGYKDDEVMAALLENGVGGRQTLELLRAVGWSVDRMVETLSHREAIASDVRDRLIDLGLPASSQRHLLLRHWDAAVVDLVLGEPISAHRLPRESK